MRTSTKSLLFSLFTSILSTGALAQPVIQQSVITNDLNKAYKIVLYETNLGIGPQLSQIIGATGPDQIWDFTGFNYVDSTVIFEEYMSVPPGDPLLNDPNFANSNIIWKNILPPVSGGLPDTTIQLRYGTLANNQWIENGSVSIVDFDSDGMTDTLVQWFSPPSLFLQFPVTANSSWTDSTSIVQEFQGMTFTSSIMVDTNTIQGWGTVITPEGSGLALRLHNKSITRVPNTPIVEVSNDLDFMTEDGGLSASIVIEDGRAFYRKRTPLDGTTSTIEISPNAFGFQLEQNFPNPFSGYTNIVFSLKNAEQVQLRVLDMGGRIVEILENEFFQAGQHQMAWQPNQLQSGIYILEMKVGGQIQHRLLNLQQ